MPGPAHPPGVGEDAWLGLATTTTNTATVLVGVIVALAAIALFGRGGGRVRSASMPRTASSTTIDEISVGAKLAKPHRFILWCLGTRGDVQPMLAVAKELARRGHYACVCAADSFASLVEAHGVDFDSCGLESMHGQEAGWVTARSQSDFIRAVAASYIPRYEDMGTALLEACRRRKATCVVTGLYGIQMALDVGEALDVAVWAVKFMPDTPTGEHPPFGARPWRPVPLSSTATRAVRKMRHWARLLDAVGAATKYDFTRRQNDFRRRKLGLGPVTMERLRAGGMYLPTIYAYSRALLPRPDDWPAWHRVAGFLTTTGAGEESALAPELEAFLRAHEEKGQRRPVCVTFGSMACLDAAGCDVVRRAVRAALGLGFPVVALTGWADAAGVTLLEVTVGGHSASSAQLFVGVAAPHELLFPRCSCVVFHGGAGTTARVAQSGVPAVVVPVLRWLDQAGWAQALTDFGSGVHVTDPWCSESELAVALGEVLIEWRTSVVFAARARDLARRLRQEETAGEGARRAVRWLLSPLASDGSKDGDNMVARHCLHRRGGGNASLGTSSPSAAVNRNLAPTT